MELRDYWHIVRRHWWLPVGLAVVAFVLSTVVGVLGAAAYRTDMRIAVGTIPTPTPGGERYYDPTYYANLDSEYLADDLSEFMHSAAFAGEVRRELIEARGLDVSVDSIVSAARTKKTHRFIDLTVVTSTPDEGREIAASISRILNDPARIAQYMKSMSAYNAQLTIVTPPDTRRSNTAAGLASEVGLRTVVGLLVGIALAFLADYLDPRFRSRQETEDVLGLPILGEIPGARRRAAA
jgi:capsular polysaccharide biosynthesis protein